MTPLGIIQHTDTITFAVKAMPGGSRDAIVGLLEGALKIKVTAPPEGGKANKAICVLIAQTLGVSRSDVTVETGLNRPQKRIAVRGLTVEQARAALAPYIDK
ncbi:MAG: DUF167 domain-containing protein [Planctomycetota bacterium]|jgi:uncharacterized protein (TIGR00251 family)